MKSIEDQIREKKAEIKEANRALSKLQDELKKKNEPNEILNLSVSVSPRYMIISGGEEFRGPWVQTINMETSKFVSNAVIHDALKSAIESLSETPSEPKWDYNDCLEWACRDNGGKWHYAASRKALDEYYGPIVHRPEPKSYVDWDDKRLDGYNWVARDKDTAGGERGYGVCMFTSVPELDDDYWTNGKDYRKVPIDAIFGPLPAWDKSLIHRPGVKE